MDTRLSRIVLVVPLAALFAPLPAQEARPAQEDNPGVYSESLQRFQEIGTALENQFARYRRASWARHRMAFFVEDAARRLEALRRGDQVQRREVPAFPEPRLLARLQNLLRLDPERASSNPAWIAQLLGRPCPDPPGPEERSDFLKRLAEPMQEGIGTYVQLETAQKKELEALLERFAALEREIAALGEQPPAPPAAPPAQGDKPPREEPADPTDEEYQERVMQEELRRRAQEQARKRSEGGVQPGGKPEAPRPVQPAPSTPRPATPAPFPQRPGPTPPPRR